MTDTGGDDPRPRGRWWREGAITATAFALCLLGGVVRPDGSTLAPPHAAAYVIAVVSGAVLPARHRAPLATMVSTTACGVLATPLGLQLSPLIVAPAVITAFSLTARTGRRAAGAGARAAGARRGAAAPGGGAL